jgi:hypothetical protein
LDELEGGMMGGDGETVMSAKTFKMQTITVIYVILERGLINGCNGF